MRLMSGKEDNDGQDPLLPLLEVSDMDKMRQTPS